MQEPNTPRAPSNHPQPEPPWEWRYSPLVGIMYGPIPVGLFIALPILIVLLAD